MRRRTAGALLREIVAALPRCAWDLDEAMHAAGCSEPTGVACLALASHRVDRLWFVCERHHALMVARGTDGLLEALAWYRAAKAAEEGT